MSTDNTVVLTNTQSLIQLIIDQKLDLDEYADKLPKVLASKFSISFIENGVNGLYALINDIIDWENGNQVSSLEAMINGYYKIDKIK